MAFASTPTLIAPAGATPSAPSAPASRHFIAQQIEADLAAHQGQPYQVKTRFPPEPNGYLHIGHAKSICLNFGLAREFGGVCHMRFDDTNPVKEDQEYVDSILENVQWLGFDWGNHLYFASDYFERIYLLAEYLIETGDAYVDPLSAEELQRYRGNFTEPGKNSPARGNSVADNLRLFREMRAGAHADGSMILRAKIDMASPNMNLRDPALYRIRRAHHHRTGDAWCLYPMYDYAHAVSDALEGITHSICTLEFADHRPLYDWVLDKLLPKIGWQSRQYEFSRLNLTYVMMSKRYLKQLVDEQRVSGWDDPRMPTLVGCRRRGFTPAGFRKFAERIGVSKADSWIDYAQLEDCMRDDLNESAERRVAVLDPLKLVITNWPADEVVMCAPANHPQKPELGHREMPLSGVLWIERDDFQATPEKGFFRLSPGSMVRLKYGFVVKCTSFTTDAAGQVTEVQCEYFADSKSGTTGSNNYKTKGVIHWVSAAHAYRAEVRLYDRLFKASHPGKATGSFLDDLNPDSINTIAAYLEPALQQAAAEQCFQFERHGYFVVDRVESRPGVPVFNRTVTLRDSWKI